jgi:hypothetical protein
VVRLTVPRHLVGRLIGKRGQTIKDLREQTGAVIEIAKDDGGVGSVTLSGAPGRVQEARALIEEESAVAIQRAARGRAARNERAVLATERDLRIEMAKRIQKAHRCMHAMAFLIAKLAERARHEERERSEAAASTMIQCSWRHHSIWKLLTRACQSVRRVALSLFCSFIFFALAMVQCECMRRHPLGSRTQPPRAAFGLSCDCPV